MGITNVLFNTIALVFLTLTLIVGMVVVMVAAGSMDSPIFAPDKPNPTPTYWFAPTLTPSPGPAIDVDTTPTPAAPGS